MMRRELDEAEGTPDSYVTITGWAAGETDATDTLDINYHVKNLNGTSNDDPDCFLAVVNASSCDPDVLSMSDMLYNKQTLSEEKAWLAQALFENNETGVADGEFAVDVDLYLESLIGKAVIMHDSEGMLVACGILKENNPGTPQMQNSEPSGSINIPGNSLFAFMVAGLVAAFNF